MSPLDRLYSALCLAILLPLFRETCPHEDKGKDEDGQVGT